jgi:hypothetical protein
VHANNLVVNDRTARQTIKGIAKLLPHFDGKPTSAFVVKTIDAVDASALVVASKEEKVFGVFDFVGKQQANDFEGLLAAVDVVAEKEIVGL